MGVCGLSLGAFGLKSDAMLDRSPVAKGGGYDRLPGGLAALEAGGR